MLALAVTSAISAVLIVFAKWQRTLGRYGNQATALLVLWALALPVLLQGPIRAGSPDVLRSALAGILIVAAALACLLIGQWLGWNFSSLKDLGSSALAHPLRTFALMVIMAPICEEYMFRGFLLHVLLRYGVVVAVAITTLLFVAAHLDPAAAPHLTIAGVIFALLALGSGGLLSPIIAHAVANLIGFIVLVRFGQRLGLVRPAPPSYVSGTTPAG